VLVDVDVDEDEADFNWTTPIPAPPKSPARTPRTMSRGRPSRAEWRFLLALSMSASSPDWNHSTAALAGSQHKMKRVGTDSRAIAVRQRRFLHRCRASGSVEFRSLGG